MGILEIRKMNGLSNETINSSDDFFEKMLDKLVIASVDEQSVFLNPGQMKLLGDLLSTLYHQVKENERLEKIKTDNLAILIREVVDLKNDLAYVKAECDNCELKIRKLKQEPQVHFLYRKSPDFFSDGEINKDCSDMSTEEQRRNGPIRGIVRKFSKRRSNLTKSVNSMRQLFSANSFVSTCSTDISELWFDLSFKIQLYFF